MIPLNIKGVKKDLYLIDENGQIYSNFKKGYLIPKKDKDGYLSISLQKQKVEETIKFIKELLH